MKIALIQPAGGRYIGYRHTAATEPLGLEAIAGALADHDIIMLDMRFDKNIKRFLNKERPEAVGVSVPFTTAVYPAQAILEEVRKIVPYAFSFIGGHHVALNPADFLGKCDSIVVGEGESTSAQLIDYFESRRPLDELTGLIFEKNGNPVFTGERPLVKTLDDLPLPNRSISKRYAERYFFRDMSPSTMIETARGCPYRCVFCSVWKFNRGFYRQKSPNRVLEEVKAAPTRDILFADDNFMSNVPRAERICRLIKEEGLKKRFGCQARTDTIANNPDMIKRWRNVGLAWVLVGFESFNEHQLKWMNKKTDVETNEAAIKILQENDIGIQAAFIVDPAYAKSDFQVLRKYIKGLKLHSCQITILTPLPGTDLFEQKRSDLTSDNYELFDFFHAVLPTNLSLKDFYKEFCKLYRKVAIRPVIKDLFKSPSMITPKSIFTGIKVFNNFFRPKVYLKGHLNTSSRSKLKV